MLVRIVHAALAVCLVMAAGDAVAQPKPASPIPTVPKVTKLDPMVEIDRAVAQSLYERGKHLLVRRDYANAKMMFIESLVRDSRGPSAKNAMAMLRTSNERLGLRNLNDGLPAPSATTATTATPGVTVPLDPYATGPKPPVDPTLGSTGNTGPVDPYAPASAPVDPYGDNNGSNKAGTTPAPAIDKLRRARRNVKIWGGTSGFLVGLAIGGPEDESGQVTAGAMVASLVGAGAGYAATHYLTRKREISPGQSLAVVSGGLWGSYMVGLFGDLVTGVGETTTNDAYRAVAVGSLMGSAGGFVWASKLSPSEGDVAVVNSFGLYGTTAGLLLGVAFDPVESEGYSINGLLGAGAGLGVGYYVSKRVEVSSRRMLRVDLAAAAGAAVPWVLLYPLISDNTTSGDEQTAGLISTLTLGGGAYLGWWLTRKMDRKAAGKSDGRVASGVPGLIQRDERGRWGAGFALVRPMGNLTLAPRSKAFSLGVDVLGGRF